MTNETEAPERIWAQDAKPDECNFIGGGWWDDSLGSTQYPHMVEYIRVDLYDAQAARIAELEAKLAKAEYAMQKLSNYGLPMSQHLMAEMRDTLAELKGTD